jgi:hypothetical protein
VVEDRHVLSPHPGFSSVPGCLCSSSSNHPLNDELARYLALPLEALYESLLDWWNLHWTDFPVLSKLAYDFLACPMMSSECERLFSRINMLLSDERRSHSPKAVESDELRDAEA